ncbi:tyrosine-type recombinase/integrase [Clostridium chromiireducens]|uniref:Tyrosine-type recombinase/integrase n=1 Tax=Clostridium chromiireducens TaxID=225345 RepID=A0A964RT47_9CLOT|nr:tyrosine-type recombinase/integrase [Clostridium chromiireducens]MVX67376.1 tyrosine-type recombinase/integrase [Clostridium chromiireducens]
MEEKKRPLTELIDMARSEMKLLNYRQSTIYSYQAVWKKFLLYTQNQTNEQYFSEKLGDSFLNDCYDCLNESNLKLLKSVRHAIRAIRVLGDYQMHNIILRSKCHNDELWLSSYGDIIDKFKEYLSQRTLSEGSMNRILHSLKSFFKFLYEQNITSCSTITSANISRYSKTLLGYSKKTLAVQMYSLRTFFKFLFLEGFHNEDLSIVVPKIRFVRRQHIPSTWTKEETEKILFSVDRGHPCGKRDYAILLLLTRLGLRESDVLNLKLDDIKWELNCIELCQTKTSRNLTLPLLKDVGWAIIEYLKQGRPITNEPFVFVKQVYPYNKMTDCYMICKKYIQLAEIKKPLGHQKGPHSFRHSLASRLLEKDIPLEMITEVLGHSNTNSTTDYLKIDIKNLIQCALDPEEVLKNE